MTNQHPLTDELLQQIGCANPRARLRSPSIPRVFDTQAMRAAYDKGRDEQLEQVIEWLKDHLEDYTWAGDPGIHTEGVIIDLKQVMRPTNTQEEN